MSIVSTGQITLIDQNDAKPITAYIACSDSLQQIFTRDESTVQFNPSWYSLNSSTGIQLSPKVYVGGTGGAATDITNILSNRKFSLNVGGDAITNSTPSSSFVDDSYTELVTPFTVLLNSSSSYLRVRGNLKESVGALTIFFEADYTDPATTLTVHIIAQTSLAVVKTGSNAVYINIRGTDSIEQSNSSTKNVVAICAELVRSSGVDSSVIGYKFYEQNGQVQVSQALSGYSTKYGFKATLPAEPVVASPSNIGVSVPIAGDRTSYNTIVISELAIDSLGAYRVEITDTAGATYQSFFTVRDTSDPYNVTPVSSTGDKLPNGIGNMTITPSVFYGANRVTDLTGWKFYWYFYDKDGNRGGFVDTSKISVAGGAPIVSNTTGSSATIGYSGSAYQFASGDVIKVVTVAGGVRFYEVSNSVGNLITIRTPVTNTWLSQGAYPYPSVAGDLIGGKLLGCVVQRTSIGAAGILVSGDDLDVKAVIRVEADRP